MEYKTVIEIINEAENPTEAADIAGEYLRGEIDSGVTIRCATKPFKRYLTLRMVFILLIAISFIGISTFRIKNSTLNIIVPRRNTSAVQPPLKTHIHDNNFVDEWNDQNR